MSDLISRSKLLKILRCCEVLVSSESEPIIKTIREQIETFPTAFDLDKVVEQLEANSTTTVYDHEDDMHNDYILQDKAIEIVRKGGVE